MASPDHYRWIVFCDFDGTITVEETFAGMLKAFAAPQFEATERLLLARKITLKQGIRHLLESIPSHKYPEMLDYIRTKPVRPGLKPLLEYLESQGIPFVVVSGGLRGSVQTRLEPLMGWIHAIYAADVDTQHTYLKVHSEFEDDMELVAKAEVMAGYAYDAAIAIGDGISDLNMALHSSIVFARDSLSRHLEKKGRNFKVWEDFFEIRQMLERLLPPS